ncbi:MAG: CbtB domain-containing protein [Acidimicrobiales bacterium]
MAAIVTAPARPGRLEVPRWAWAVLAVAVALLWLVTMEGAAVSEAVGGTSSFLHELFHDGRHLLGVPCH